MLFRSGRGRERGSEGDREREGDEGTYNMTEASVCVCVLTMAPVSAWVCQTLLQSGRLLLSAPQLCPLLDTPGLQPRRLGGGEEGAEVNIRSLRAVTHTHTSPSPSLVSVCLEAWQCVDPSQTVAPVQDKFDSFRLDGSGIHNTHTHTVKVNKNTFYFSPTPLPHLE